MPIHNGKDYTWKELKKQHPEEFYKRKRISVWVARGLETDEEEVYEKYLNTFECENCGIELNTGIGARTDDSRTMDHDHKTGEFRNILCHRCNILRGEHDALVNK